MRAGLRFYQVQAQLIAKHGEWTSSRQARTTIVGAVGPLNAGQEVSHLAWGASSGDYVSRRTIATVVEVINGDGGDAIPTGQVSWVMVDYYPSGAIVATSADTYAELVASDAYKRFE